eukprot:TRINITY_DN12949_c0_g1_i2.p2 TRINITY_DN12949_c0_g1~~TRINITY_DN12949_c0_g1_i2.p2  ORF type:complete len:170 (+),score=4.80 TRINITY_DN12949_c0_g1_i2:64-573(+)
MCIRDSIPIAENPMALGTYLMAFTVSYNESGSVNSRNLSNWASKTIDNNWHHVLITFVGTDPYGSNNVQFKFLFDGVDCTNGSNSLGNLFSNQNKWGTLNLGINGGGFRGFLRSFRLGVGEVVPDWSVNSTIAKNIYQNYSHLSGGRILIQPSSITRSLHLFSILFSLS